MDIIPSDLATYGSEAKKLLQDLQSRNERMFLVSFLVLNTADNPRQLGNNIFQGRLYCPESINCQLTRLDFQAGRRADELSASGTQSDRDPARADHQFYGYLCTVHHTGTVSERQRSPVLRHQCSVQQPHHGGPKASEKPQRLDFGYAGFR